MKKMVKNFCSILVIGFVSLSFIACDILPDLLGIGGGDSGGVTNFIPTNDQMVLSLKEALTTGSSDTSATLSKQDAFYQNSTRHIPLPNEATTMITNLKSNSIGSSIFTAIGGDTEVNNLILRINRAAEEASKDVARIFANAILEMTFDDARTILLGKNSEATDYFRAKTKTELTAAFKVPLDEALGKPIVSNISALSAWNGVLTPYNNFVNSTEGKLAMVLAGVSWKPIETDLSVFVLDLALNAVFNEIAEMEKRIRDDPLKFVSDTLGALSNVAKDVFQWAKTAIGI